MMNLICKIIGHDWSMYRGYHGHPHHTAICKRCKAKPKGVSDD